MSTFTFTVFGPTQMDACGKLDYWRIREGKRPKKGSSKSCKADKKGTVRQDPCHSVVCTVDLECNLESIFVKSDVSNIIEEHVV